MNVSISAEFLDNYRSDPVQGTIDLCEEVLSSLVDGHEWQESEYEALTRGYALVLELAEAGLYPLDVGGFEFTGNIQADCSNISAYFTQTKERCVTEASKLRLDSIRAQFRTALGVGFCYEFSRGDLERIQVLLNELRDLITVAEDLDSDHRRRLLKRLEKLQGELHKKVSDLDRFWGLVGDAGVVLGKLGTDAKPIVDRIAEITRIVWRTQGHSEELPSETSFPPIGVETSSDE